MFDLTGRKIFVSGHKGMVGSALLRRLRGEGCETLTALRADLDLREQAAVQSFMERHRPDVVVIAADTNRLEIGVDHEVPDLSHPGAA